jgi:hypothetical protein
MSLRNTLSRVQITREHVRITAFHTDLPRCHSCDKFMSLQSYGHRLRAATTHLSARSRCSVTSASVS